MQKCIIQAERSGNTLIENNQIKQGVKGFALTALRLFLGIVLYNLLFLESGKTEEQSLNRRDAIISRAWLQNDQNYLTPDAIAQEAWTIFEGSLSLGYTKSTTWLRLNIDPQIIKKNDGINRARLVLRVLPNHLNEIAVFYTNQLTSPAYVLGDTPDRPLNGLYFISNAVVLSDIQVPFDIILRVRTDSNHTIDAVVLGWDGAVEENYSRLTFILVYIVFLGIVTIFSIIKYFTTKDRLILLFIMVNLTAIVLGALLLGLFRLKLFETIDPIVFDRFTSLIVPFYFLSLLVFHSQILKYFGISNIFYIVMCFITIIPILTVVMVVSGYVLEGLLMTQVTIPLSAIFVFLSTLSIKKNIESETSILFRWQKGYLIFTYGILAAVSIPQSLRILGIKKYGEPFFGGFAAYSIMSTILLGFVLLVRSRQLEIKRAEREKALSLVSQEVEYLKNKALEQSELITMLTHELKTPMSVVTLALGPSGKNIEIQERAHRAVKNIKDIIQRCEHMARLEYPINYSDVGIEYEKVEIVEILRDVIMLNEAVENIEVTSREKIPVITTNRQLIFVVINNLIENSLKYGLVGKKIEIIIEKHRKDGVDGIQIAFINEVGKAGRPDSKQIFEKYYRSPHARYSSGSGLGLYLAKKFAELLKGDIKLVDGEKVRFELWIPV